MTARPRLRYAALGPVPFDRDRPGDAILGLGATPEAALAEARAWQPDLASVGPLRTLPLTHPFVGLLLHSEEADVAPNPDSRWP